MKQVIDNIKINSYERGSVLYQKGCVHKFSYVVLVGQVNFYDREINFTDYESFYVNDKQIADRLQEISDPPNEDDSNAF